VRHALIVGRQIARNARAVPTVRRRRTPPAARASGAEMSPAEAAAYADTAFRTLIDAAGVAAAELDGAAVLEVGPGESLAFGMRAVAAGAREVVAVDRFATLAGAGRQAAIYAALAERLPQPERGRAEAALRPGADPPLDPARVRLLPATPAEHAGRALAGRGFDLILSVAALQHVGDAEAAVRELDRLIAPGGVQVHQVDFSDMGVFSGHGLHPLTFLTVSDRVYRWMGSNLGGANRTLIDGYRALYDELGYDARLIVTKLYGDDAKLDPPREELAPGRDFGERHLALLDEIRPRLAPRYRALADADLLAHATVIVARKRTA
jgi:SAM-dependent methyltransferase